VNLVPHRPRQVREIISAAERIAGVIVRESGQPIERVRADIERDLQMPADAAITYDLGSRYITRRESCPPHEIAAAAGAVPLTGSIR